MANLETDLFSGTHKLPSAKLPILQAPGPESNYLDWEFVVTSYFEAAGLEYILEKPRPDNPPTVWLNNNKIVCALITQAINTSNLWYVRKNRQHAYGMWFALNRAHQDQTTGGHVYWLRKLLLTKMDGDDILTHINTMAKFYEQINSLISPKNPLTADNVHAAALLSSIPQDWLHCVSSLMNQDGFKSETIVLALKNKHTRQQSQSEVKASVLSAVSKSKQANSSEKSSKHCYFCNADGHDLNNCNNTQRILMEHKHSRKPPHDGQRPKKHHPKESKQPARAGRMTAAVVSSKTESGHSQEDTNYSGSKLEVHAAHAVTFEHSYSVGVDANLDSGCSILMTPFSSSLKQISPNNTPVQLADHSLVKATHRGSWKLPLQVDKEVKTSIVPLLHKPLLSIAAICDLGLTVVFTSKNC